MPKMQNGFDLCSVLGVTVMQPYRIRRRFSRAWQQITTSPLRHKIKRSRTFFSQSGGLVDSGGSMRIWQGYKGPRCICNDLHFSPARAAVAELARRILLAPAQTFLFFGRQIENFLTLGAAAALKLLAAFCALQKQ